jgi:large subunit ribosomal protein L5
MATTPSLLSSSGSSFLSQFPTFPTQFSSSLLSHGNHKHRSAVVSVKAIASGAVLVEKSEAEQVYRLKTTYNDKIVPLLIEEFSYTNIHQVFVKFRFFFVMGIPCNCLILRFC